MADFAPHDLTSNTSHSPFVASASSEFYGYNAYHAFDGAIDYWLGLDAPQWLKLDVGLGNAYLLSDYSIKVFTSGGDSAPKDWTMQGSNDGYSWDTLDTVSGEIDWASGETRNFVCDTVETYYRLFRVYVTASVSNPSYVHIAELYLYGTAGDPPEFDFAPHYLTSNTSHSPLVVSTSTSDYGPYGYLVFDGLYTGLEYWQGTNSGVDWVKLDLGDGNSRTLSRYAVRFHAGISSNLAPKDWTMEGSNNDSDWDTLDTVTGQTTWGSGEVRAFECDTATTAYRYFRLNISANQSGTATNVGELHLIEASAAASDTTITPVAGALTITGYAPTVSASDHKSISPGAGSLSITGYAPTLAISDHKTVAPGLAELTITGYAPTVTVSGNAVISPATGVLSITGFAPNLATSDHKIISPAPGELLITGYAPTVTAGTGHITIIPAPGALTLTGYAPTVSVNFPAPRIFGTAPTAGSGRMFGTAPTGTPRVFGDNPTAGLGRIFKQ